MRTFHTQNPAETEALGERLGQAAVPGLVVHLQGDLGAGKTAFARGVGRGLQIDTRVQSPTFVIVHMHEGGRLPFAHADLYRLADPDELLVLGLDEFDDGVLLVEWADRFPEVLPTDHLVIALTEVEGHLDHRRIDGRGHGPRALAVLEAM